MFTLPQKTCQDIHMIHQRPSNLSTSTCHDATGGFARLSASPAFQSKMSRCQRRLARLSMLLCHRTFSSYQAISWDLEAITLKNYQKLISKDLQVDLAGMRGNTSAGLPEVEDSGDCMITLAKFLQFLCIDHFVTWRSPQLGVGRIGKESKVFAVN